MSAMISQIIPELYSTWFGAELSHFQQQFSTLFLASQPLTHLQNFLVKLLSGVSFVARTFTWPYILFGS
jgi:hypothetical protein